MAAQNITIAGASYNAVPAITVPKQGSGTARYTDVSDTTATASDVAIGKYFYNSAGTKIEGTSSGGGSGYITVTDTTDAAGGTIRTITPTEGTAVIQSNKSVTIESNGTTTISPDTGNTALGSVTVVTNVSGGGGVTVEPLSVTQNGTYTAPTGKAYSPVSVNVSSGASAKAVNFIDYDGTILHSYTAAEFAQLSDLPANPTHTGLTAQGWNWTKAQITAQLTAVPNGPVWVGQMYITSSGDTEIDVVMQADALEPYITLGINGTVTVDWGDNTTADTMTGTNLTSSKYQGHTYAAAGSYTIKIHVVSGSFAFYRVNNLLPSPLSIDESATQAKSLKYTDDIIAVRLGSGITAINKNGFLYCTSLTTITIPNTVTSINSFAFAYCYSLTSVTMPSSLTSVSESALNDCYLLSSVSLPSGITSVGPYAFANCYTLPYITLPSGITSIGQMAFSSCRSLALLEIPSTVTTIDANAFSACSSLKSVAIPCNINTYAFANCALLASVTLSSGVTSIGTYAFSNCGSLTSIVIPNTVTSIGDYAFQSCVSLTTVTLPSTGTSIGPGVFSSCCQLSSITLPSTITSINASTFSLCKSLPSVTIPNSVTSIGNSAFSTCQKFTSLTIPSGVTSIGTYAFQNFNSADSIIFLPTTPPTITNTNVFYNIPVYTKIYVPYSADHSVLEAYQTANYWSTYASRMVELPA